MATAPFGHQVSADVGMRASLGRWEDVLCRGVSSYARSCSGCLWTAVAGLHVTLGALWCRHGGRLRLGAEIGGWLLIHM